MATRGTTKKLIGSKCVVPWQNSAMAVCHRPEKPPVNRGETKPRRDPQTPLVESLPEF